MIHHCFEEDELCLHADGLLPVELGIEISRHLERCAECASLVQGRILAMAVAKGPENATERAGRRRRHDLD